MKNLFIKKKLPATCTTKLCNNIGEIFVFSGSNLLSRSCHFFLQLQNKFCWIQSQVSYHFLPKKWSKHMCWIHNFILWYFSHFVDPQVYILTPTTLSNFFMDPQVYIAMDPQVYIGMDPRVYIGMDPQVYIDMDPRVYIAMDPQVYIGMDPRVYIGMDPQVYICPISKYNIVILATVSHKGSSKSKSLFGLLTHQVDCQLSQLPLWTASYSNAIIVWHA